MNILNLNVKLISKLENIDYTLKGKYNKEKEEITYYEQDELNTKVKFNYENNMLIRENKNLYLEYKFINNEETKGKIYIKELNKQYEILINTKSIKRDKNNIEIEYILENINYKYIIREKD